MHALARFCTCAQGPVWALARHGDLIFSGSADESIKVSAHTHARTHMYATSHQKLQLLLFTVCAHGIHVSPSLPIHVCVCHSLLKGVEHSKELQLRADADGAPRRGPLSSCPRVCSSTAGGGDTNRERERVCVCVCVCV